MAALITEEELIENLLTERMKRYTASNARTFSVFDRSNKNFILMDEGWNGYRRIHHIWLHVEIKEGKFWIQEDGTEEGFANALLQAGIPKTRIVLALHHPKELQNSEFATV